MTSVTQQVAALASLEGVLALVEKFDLDKTEAMDTFTETHMTVFAHAAEGDGICLRIGCEQQVSPMSSLVCSDHLTEISA